MSNSFHFVSKKGRKLLNVLEDAGGILLYNEVVKEMKGVCSESTTNRLLNDLSDKGLIFRIEHDGKIFYRINDFPLNVKALLVLLDCAIKDKELAIFDMPAVKEGESLSEQIARMVYHYLYQTPKDKQELVVYQTLKRNIIRLYPKLDLRKICLLTIGEIEASASGNQSLLNFLEGFKATLD